MCQLVGSVDKPKVMRAMLLKLFLLNHYSKFRDVLPFVADSQEPPTDLHSFLKSNHVTVAKLKLESTYRGIKISNYERKSAIANAVYAHVLSNLYGYVNQDNEHT